MTIGFHTAVREIPDLLINNIKRKLLEFHRKVKAISRAEVYFRKHPATQGNDYVCEIAITMFGNSIMVRRNADSYQEAANEVTEELTDRLDEQLQKQRDFPDDIVSSVRV
jgi:ribosome-associated translation inhibitor RaiA